MRPDPWLNRWLPLALERAGNMPILEIGCGTGEDSETLVASGVQVIAFDLSEEAIAVAQARVPAARFSCQDIRHPFPLESSVTNLVMASLSLHYFPWAETVALIGRVRNVLRSEGLLFCRLNSTNDHNYGATGHVKIEHNYYSVNGEPKRFFDRSDIDRLFGNGWRILSLEEKTTDKYSMPKVLWEVILEKDA